MRRSAAFLVVSAIALTPFRSGAEPPDAGVVDAAARDAGARDAGPPLPPTPQPTPSPIPTPPGAPPPSPIAHIVPHLDVQLVYRQGRVSVERITRGTHVERAPSPNAPRFDQRGRFTARLREGGRDLGELVRFDFPLLADADAGEAVDLNERMKANVTAKTSVRLPAPPPGARGVHVVIVDGKNNAEVKATVPPEKR